MRELLSDITQDECSEQSKGINNGTFQSLVLNIGLTIITKISRRTGH